MKKLTILLAGLALATSATFASAGAGTRIDYAAYAGDSVKEISYFQLYNWQRSTDKAVVLWTKPSAAFFLTLEHTCDSLRGSRVTIEVGGAGAVPGRLRTGDDLIVGPIKCRVTNIQPIDLEAIKRDRK
jgi:hypothetical protein